MKPTPFLRPLRAALALLALSHSGCALMRKETAPLASIPAEQIRLADTLKLARDGWPEAQWWRRYGDPQLEALMTLALQDAPLMTLARSRVEASQAYAALVEAGSGVSIGLGASIDRQQVSEHSYLGPFYQNIPAEGFTGPRYTEMSIGLKADYSFDFWGKDKARVEAALGLKHARQAERAQAERVLTSRIAQFYFHLQSLYATQDLLEQSRAIELERVRGHEARAARGLEPRTPGQEAQARQLDLEQQLSAARAQAARLREGIRALAGAGPDRLPPLRPIPLPSASGQLPATLGYELLARRADLQAMRWYVQASMSQLDAARAAFYPSFDLRAAFGADALHTNQLMQNSSRFFNLVPGLSLPIFDSGRLNAALANAGSQRNTLMAQYQQAVVDAVREVAQSALEVEALGRQLGLQEARLKALRFTQDSAEAHYGRGLADRLTALEARLPVLLQQRLEVQLRERQIGAEIDLTLALGGGYDGRSILRPDVTDLLKMQ